jgi:XRE family transcriptional regulator, regulator of sulfur utilization
MITRRDIVVALIAASGTLAVAAAQQPAPAPILKSRVFDWTAMTAKENAYGSSRAIVRAPTVTLDELEMHVTTLNPGQTSHAPHQHGNEELIILREGTLETLSLGEWKRIGPGSIIFNAANDLHGVKNVGTVPAVYHVVNWRTPATPPTQK